MHYVTCLERLTELQLLLDKLRAIGRTKLEKDQVFIQFFDVKNGYLHMGKSFYQFGNAIELNDLLLKKIKAARSCL